MSDYYGRMDAVNIKKSHGVHYFMLDVHIEKLVDKHIARFQKEIGDLIIQFKREAFSGLSDIKNSVAVLRRGLIETKELIKKKHYEKTEMEEVINNVKKLRGEK